MKKKVLRGRKGRIKAGLAVCLVFIVSALFPGCGHSRDTGESEVIELLDPAPVLAGTEAVARRNLYHAEVYEVMVYPYVEEYCFQERQTFGAYYAMAGDRVEKGAPIAYAEEGDVLGQIERLEESIRLLTQNHEEDIRKTEETFDSQTQELERIEEILENLEAGKPEEYLVGSGGERNPNPAYAAWQKEWDRNQGQYSLYEYYLDSGAEKLRQRTRLYELDLEYYNTQLSDLREQEKRGVITSGITGTIISRPLFRSGASVPAGRTAAAAADLERKFLRCSAIDNIWSMVRNSKDLYAFFHGRRVEIAYDEESAAGYSDFRLLEDRAEAEGRGGVPEVGDYGVVVIVADSREQVPTVSVDAVYIEGRRRYVYVLEDGKSVPRDVETGMSDGVYTEILSGLAEGEKVLVQQEQTAGGGRSGVLVREDFQSNFSGNAELYYPVIETVKNPVQNGTAFFRECQVVQGQWVEAGDVIATIRVEGDSYELARREIELKRAKERLADLEAGGSGGNEEAIAERQEWIGQMEEELAQIQADYSTTAICAGISGIVGNLAAYEEGDIIKPDETVAELSDIGRGYLIADSYQLDYGDELSVVYTDWDGNRCGVQGKVVNLRAVPRRDVSVSQRMLVALPEGEIRKIQSVKETAPGQYAEMEASVSGVVRVMENVVKVPREAVTTVEGQTYVNVLGEDGTVTPVGFLAGGGNADSYWVLEGLTEGMTICWE